jgi:threonine dehydratase
MPIDPPPASPQPRQIGGPRPTTVLPAPRLSTLLGADVTIATETFQYTGSFKFRAAWHVARSVPHPRIICASSGNFGQALALACQLTGKQCTIVMPDASARVKVDAVRAYGATVDMIDTRTVAREARVNELAAADPEAYVASPYNDPLVIEGNASLGRELAALGASTFDAIVAPVGGGGLTAGILTGLRALACHTPLHGAEPLLANDAARSLRAGHLIVDAQEAPTMADGARTRGLGQHNWAILKDQIAAITEVPEEAIAEGVRLYFSLVNLKAEPTGALSLGALLHAREQFAGKRVCLVVSGGNVDPATYAALLQTP